MKRILFVINTMGRAGAEAALVEFLRRLAPRTEEGEYEIYLYVLMAQGEMIDLLPPYVKLLNTRFSAGSVLSGEGRRMMAGTVLRAFFRNGGIVRKLSGAAGNLADMIKSRRFQTDKLLWRAVSDGARRFEQTFDLALAWLEGGSAYYVAEHVKARRKAAIIHIDYEKAGYTRGMDRDCWREYDRIFAVSREGKESFCRCYPEYASKVSIFHNMIDRKAVRRRAGEPGGFSDEYDGMRILTVGRLTWQKAVDVAMDAMKLLKDAGYHARWYVLGEGSRRRALEKKAAELGLEEDFLLPGAVENPYPWYVQADLYVHATRYEGRSIALEEALILGCAVVASDCDGNRGLIEDGENGVLCRLSAPDLAQAVAALLEDEKRRRELGRAAKEREMIQEQDDQTLFGLLS